MYIENPIFLIPFDLAQRLVGILILNFLNVNVQFIDGACSEVTAIRANIN